MTTTVIANHTGGSGPLSLMSCVRESSPQESIHETENDKNVTSKKKFWNPRKWFKRKSQKVVEVVSPNSYEHLEPNIKDVLRSRSTSELSESDEPISRRRSGTPMHPGLSVSHDSIFHSPNSGSELDLEEAQSSSSLSTQHHLPTQTELRLQTELSERLRLRRGREDVSEDDEGLPRSPCCNSPTATEGLLEKTAVKNHPSKSHSTCSDGSLLSMGSSEIEEDSFGQQSSRHSSKLSLYEKKTIEQDSEWELGPGSTSAPLNHSAAHHKVSVRPKRTHGAPRRKRMQPIIAPALPTTPEVNEDSSARSSTPETLSKETITELYSSKKVNISKTETQIKCSSLPLGLAGPVDENNKLNRSRSSAGIKSQDVCGTLGEEAEEDQDDKKADQSIFARLFPRRSAKKKKNKESVVQTVHSKTLESSHTYTKFTDKRSYVETKSKSIPRTGPAFRQRVQPIDIPDTLFDIPRETEIETIQLPNESSKQSNSPLQLELEHHFRQRMPPLSTSPSKYPLPNNFETSPKLFKSSTTSQIPTTQKETIPNKNRFVISDDSKNKIKPLDESKSKVKIAGLSSLQQRALHQDDDVAFKSLTDFISNESNRFVKKSHSFKNKTNENHLPPPIMSKSDTIEKFVSRDASEKFIIEEKLESQTIFKASSLDSVKTLDSEEVHRSESSESLDSAQTSLTEYLDSLNPSNSITISGPSHTSVVNISTSLHDAQIVDSIVKQSTTKSADEDEEKDQQVSITKIEVKRQSNESLTDFTNIQKPNVNLAPKSPSPIEENKPKTVFNFELTPKDEPSIRKFSLDDIEVVDKEVRVETPCRATSTPSTPNVIITSMTPPTTTRLFKKHFETSQVRKSSLVSFTNDSKHRLSLRTKSNSLDIVDTLKRTSETTEGEILKQKVSSTTDLQESLTNESVILRRKPLVKQRQDDEPELMKVFARRSLKLKDGEELVPQSLEGEEPIFDSLDIIPKSKDSDKENIVDSPEERKKSFIITPEKPKEILVDSKFVETTEVVLRKPINNRLLAFQQKTCNLNVPKVNELNEKVQKISLVNEKINNNKSWINVQKQEENNKEDIVFKKIAPNDVITNISSKSDYINEDFPALPKNFNQRKAEWEKRAQEALKKNVP